MARQTNQNDRSHRMRSWQAHIKAQKKSGLSRAAYCRQHQLSYHAATYWSKRFSKASNPETTLVPVTIKSGFKVGAVPDPRSVLKVLLPNRIVIEVDDGFSPVTLTKLLMTLERR